MNASLFIVGMLNTPEIILILALALILFGAKKLPELARGLGSGIKEFKKASREVTNELQSAMDAEPPPPPPAPRPAESAQPQFAQSTQPTETTPEPAPSVPDHSVPPEARKA